MRKTALPPMPETNVFLFGAGSRLAMRVWNVDQMAEFGAEAKRMGYLLAQEEARGQIEKANEARRQAQAEAADLKERMARVRIDLQREMREQGWTPPGAGS